MVKSAPAEKNEMLRVRVRWLGQAASLLTALGLVACGGSQGTVATSPAGQLQTTMSVYYAALARHDAAAACAHITAAFWEASLSEGRTALTVAGVHPLPRGSCVQVLHQLFSLNPTSGSRLTKLRVTVRDVSVHGATALAIVSNGRSAQESRFVRSASGHWLIDCCTATQVNSLARRVHRVPSVGMEPTLKPGQLVTADNKVLRTRAPSRGEIVTLHPPVGPACPDPRQGEGYRQPCGAPERSASADVVIKRVVGTPGDRIALVGGFVVRNGLVVHEPYILACGAALCNFPKPIVVPPGSYYLLGDNRGNSLDSRFYGPVPRASILGPVTP